MQYIEQFLDHMKVSRYSKSSLENYRYILRKADRWLTDNGITDERSITEQQMLTYIQYLVNDVQSDWIHFNSTLYLKKYFAYLEQEQIIFVGPMRNIPLPKEVKCPTKTLTRQEIINAFDKIDTTTDIGIRLRTILEVLYSASLRPGEVANILLTDIDYIGRTLFIRLAKGKKDRKVPVGNVALEWIKRYITEVRPKYLKNKDSPYLFVSHNRTGKPITYEAVYALIYRNLKRYGIPHFKPYSLRPSSATHMLQNGMGILHIKEILGHEEVTTTRTYLRVNTLDLKKVMEEHHPLFNMKGADIES
jgi:integrase/recombinase XerD